MAGKYLFPKEDFGKKELYFMEIKNNHTPKYKMAENVKKLMAIEKAGNHIISVKITGKVVYRGLSDDNVIDDIQYINYRDLILSF